MGIFHHISPKHLNRYVIEFMAKHNYREFDTEVQMSEFVMDMKGKR